MIDVTKKGFKNECCRLNERKSLRYRSQMVLPSCTLYYMQFDTPVAGLIGV